MELHSHCSFPGGEIELDKAFFERAVQRHPKPGSSRHGAGFCIMEHDGRNQVRVIPDDTAATLLRRTVRKVR